MSFDKKIQRIAIVGTGVIGASWAAQYLARGFDVIATDPAPNAEANLRKYVDEAWPALTDIGLSPGASRDRLSFTTNMKEALSQAGLRDSIRPPLISRKNTRSDPLPFTAALLLVVGVLFDAPEVRPFAVRSFSSPTSTLFSS